MSSAVPANATLAELARVAGKAELIGGRIVHLMPTSGRQSFAPDATFYLGPLPADPMRFIAGPPTFAVEVRSENDYGAAAELDLAAKRADYFEAGTRIVWDVDPVHEVVRKYSPVTPQQPTTFSRGQVADADPAVLGWQMAVDRIFA